MAIELLSPPGRIVWGHPTKLKTKTDNKRQPVLNADGTPKQITSFGLAIEKSAFQASIWPAMSQEASTAYPQGVPPAFSWKYTDGDGVDREGKPYNQREGYAGCYVLAISSEWAPQLFKFENGSYRQMAPEEIKTGDFVAVGLNIKVNVPTDRTHTPGLYVNPIAVDFVGYGAEIVTQGSVDPNALFGGQQRQLPPGASATPVGNPNAPGLPGMGMQPPGQPMAAPAYAQPGQMAPQGYQPQPGAPMAAPGQYAPQPGAPAQYAQPGQMPGGMPAPAPDFVHNVTGGAPAPAYAQPGQMAPQGYQPQPGAPMAAPGQYAPQPGGMPGMMPPR